ncbi:hypothetical protein GGR28_002727 [Lewinella aquimaris]|uniref:Beta-lactamase-related domain-containing protein n=1 Tax=Neolewinella aquimaris TaxID=1835722 RepID=A0A840E9S0_9BACT|nr:serine hydrolase [Neolewinella aquimaris]MBB4080097.1 hypothetical protein [Neolewinella aquimaris]
MHTTPLKRWLVGITLLGVILFAAFLWLRPLLSIGGGYAAKHACSCHFLQGRDLGEISTHDLNFSVLGYYSLETRDSFVHASFFGLVDRRAKFLGDRGCVLVNEEKLPLPVGGDAGARKFKKEPALVAPVKFAEALDYGMQPVPGGGARGIVILKDGQIVGERYAPGFDENTPLLGWSMTKTLTGMAVGALVRRIPRDTLGADTGVRRPSGAGDAFAGLGESGFYSSDEPSLGAKGFGGRGAKEFGGRGSEINLADLLHMNSGLAWNEGYGSITDATVMLHERPDFAEFALRSPVIEPPGTVWNYSSGTSNILMEYLRRELGGNQALYAFLDSIFAPAAPSLLIEPDQSGRPVGSSYGWATARDWTRLGQFMLQDGVWNGDTLLPPGWIDYMRQPAAGSEGIYGAHLWLPGPDMPSLPDDAYTMRGFQDQRVIVIPSRQLVIARLGHGEDKVTDFDGLISRILAADE